MNTSGRYPLWLLLPVADKYDSIPISPGIDWLDLSVFQGQGKDKNNSVCALLTAAIDLVFIHEVVMPIHSQYKSCLLFLGW